MTYNSVHRQFLRAVMGLGVMKFVEAEEFVSQIDTESESYDIEQMVRLINHELQPLQQNLKVVTDEVTEEKMIVFLSLALDSATKSANIFTANELEYFRKILESIVTTDRRQLTLAGILNLTPPGKISKTDATKLLSTWTRMKYLDKTDNCYGLGVRGIHEFEAYIRRNIPDSIEECTLCKQVVFQGCNCPFCHVAVHTRCLNKYLEKVEKWPCCKVDFTGLPDHHNLSGDRLQESVSIMETNTQNDTAITANETELMACDEDEPPPLVSQCVADKRRKRPRE